MLLSLFRIITCAAAAALVMAQDATTSSSSSPLPPHIVALDLAFGNWRAQATRTFVVSGIAEAMADLCENHTTAFVSVEDIAHKAGTHPAATYRLLRYLATVLPASGSIVVEGDRQQFTLGEVGATLTPHHPHSVAAAVKWEASFTSVQVWNQLPQFVQTNQHQFSKAFGSGANFWRYLQDHPDILQLFIEAMTGFTNEHAVMFATPELSPTFDLSSYQTVCDYGAAQGRLALGLNERFPSQQYILADLPDVVERIDKSALPTNFKVQATNFLEQPAPMAGAYLLKTILHDWDDHHAGIILNNIAISNPNATVFIIEMGPMPDPNVPHVAKGFDLHMGLLFNGKERSQTEYDVLWEENGWHRVAVHRLGPSGAHPYYVQELKYVGGSNGNGTPVQEEL